MSERRPSAARPLRRPSTGSRRQGAVRDAAEQRILSDVEAWRAAVVPDADAPLDANDLTYLFRSFVDAMGLDPAIASGVTVNTVHYYRRKDIIDPPDGRTAAARYALRHFWQVAGARLAGHLGLVTLAEAREAMRGADAARLLDFLVARVADARARASLRSPPTVEPDAHTATSSAARPLSRRGKPTAPEPPPAAPAVMIPLPGAAWCVVPASHPAHRSAEAAGELTRALAQALRTHRTSGD